MRINLLIEVVYYYQFLIPYIELSWTVYKQYTNQFCITVLVFDFVKLFDYNLDGEWVDRYPFESEDNVLTEDKFKTVSAW